MCRRRMTVRRSVFHRLWKTWWITSATSRDRSHLHVVEYMETSAGRPVPMRRRRRRRWLSGRLWCSFCRPISPCLLPPSTPYSRRLIECPVRYVIANEVDKKASLYNFRVSGWILTLFVLIETGTNTLEVSYMKTWWRCKVSHCI